ncbi:MAG: cytochrome C [Hydrogenophaga sp.]|uniref:cytochrome C n=1 Tax=Hydrogenophaga sp. TaxID=1904254 RepID=UPI002721250D|nr:cytochrome C [Hydrogenophaga sp.]MDO9028812.1 cytochrome C [Hydrogenophaga sp.]
MNKWTLAMLVATLGPAVAVAQPDRHVGRGELLYSTYCGACHGEQLHWRDKKAATDWTSLTTEVRRWQAVGNLGWSEDDIAAVTRYLNTLHYHYPVP